MRCMHCLPKLMRSQCEVALGVHGQMDKVSDGNKAVEHLLCEITQQRATCRASIKRHLASGLINRIATTTAVQVSSPKDVRFTATMQERNSGCRQYDMSLLSDIQHTPQRSTCRRINSALQYAESLQHMYTLLIHSFASSMSLAPQV